MDGWIDNLNRTAISSNFFYTATAKMMTALASCAFCIADPCCSGLYRVLTTAHLHLPPLHLLLPPTVLVRRPEGGGMEVEITAKITYRCATPNITVIWWDAGTQTHPYNRVIWGSAL